MSSRAPVLPSKASGPVTASVIPQEQQEPLHSDNKADHVQDQRTLSGGVTPRVQLERRVQHAVQACQQSLAKQKKGGGLIKDEELLRSIL